MERGAHEQRGGKHGSEVMGLKERGSPTHQSWARPPEGGEETTGRQHEDATFSRGATRMESQENSGAAVRAEGWKVGTRGKGWEDVEIQSWTFSSKKLTES